MNNPNLNNQNQDNEGGQQNQGVSRVAKNSRVEEQERSAAGRENKPGQQG